MGRAVSLHRRPDAAQLLLPHLTGTLSQSSSRCQLLSTQTAGKRLWLHTLTGHMCSIFVRASEKASEWVFTGTLPLHRPLATCTPPHSDQQLSLSSELAKGRMLGPFPPSWKRHLHINRFGSIPKGHNTWNYRLITNFSHPRGSSVNDGIDPALTSLTYITVDSVMQVVQQLGKGSLQAKMDIESEYRLVPVHSQDRILQAVE